MIDEHLSAIKEDIAQHRKMITAVAEEDRAEENPNARDRNPNITLTALMEANQQWTSRHRS